MEYLLSIIVSLAFFPLELLAAALVFTLPVEKRPQFAGRIVLAGLMVAAVTSLYIVIGQIIAPATSGTFAEISQGAGLSSLIWCGILFGLMVLELWFTHAISFREAAYCASCAYLMEHMAYCVRTILAAVLPGLPIDAGTPLYFLSLAVIYACGYLFFVRHMVRDRHYATTAVDSFGLSLGVLAVVMGLSIAASQFGFETLHAVYALVCGVFALAGQVKQQKQLQLQQELDLQQQLWLRQKAQYEMSRENIELINRKCHDLKHQVAALKHIHDPEQQDKVIDSLQESVMIYDSILKTDNEILDTVLTEKSLLCNRHKITLTCIADGRLLSFMDAVDLYTLFGNALDNAIEASLALPESDRMIDLQVRQKAGLIIVRMTNRFAGTVEVGEDLPRSSKEDQGWHGFGLKSIRAVAEKYGGLLDLHAEDGVFTLRITIPANR